MKGRRRLKRDQLDRRVELLQPSRGPDEGAARPQSGDEVRQRAGRLLDDLRSSRVVMGAPVPVVVVLVRIEVLVRTFRVEAPRFANGPIGTLERARQNELGPKGAEDELTLMTGVLGNAQLDLVTLGRADHGVRDAGISGCRIQDRLSVAELA